MNEIEFVENYLGVKLTPYQRQLVSVISKTKGNYITYPRHCNEMAIRLMWEVMKKEK